MPCVCAHYFFFSSPLLSCSIKIPKRWEQTMDFIFAPLFWWWNAIDVVPLAARALQKVRQRPNPTSSGIVETSSVWRTAGGGKSLMAKRSSIPSWHAYRVTPSDSLTLSLTSRLRFCCCHLQPIYFLQKHAGLFVCINFCLFWLFGEFSPPLIWKVLLSTADPGCRHTAALGQSRKSRRVAAPKRIWEWPCQRRRCPTCSWSNLPCSWKGFKPPSAEWPSPGALLTRWKNHQFSRASAIETWAEIRPELNVPSTCFLPYTGPAQPYLFFFFINMPLLPNMLVKDTSWKWTLHMGFSWRLQTPEHLEGSGTKQKMCLPHEKGPGGRVLNVWVPLAGPWLCWLPGHCAGALHTARTSGLFDGIWIVALFFVFFFGTGTHGI